MKTKKEDEIVEEDVEDIDLRDNSRYRMSDEPAEHKVEFMAMM